MENGGVSVSTGTENRGVGYMLDVDIDRAARTVVETCMRVRRDEVILVKGDVKAWDFVEALLFHVQAAGAFPVLKLDSERGHRRRMTELPGELIARVPGFDLATLEQVTGYISVNSQSEKKNLGLPKAALAASHAAYEQASRILKKNDVRVIVATYPTPAQAEALGMGYEEYHDLTWRAFLVDLAAVAAECGRVRSAFGRGRAIHLTSPKGTDLRMSVEGRSIRIDDAIFTPEDLAGRETITNIPCGEVFMAPLEPSANGVAVFDEITADGIRIRDLSCRFENGRIVAFSSPLDDVAAFGRMLDGHSGEPRVIAELGLGLNPEVHKAVGSIFLDEKIYGSCHIAVGDNYRYGGDNRSSLHFDMVIMQPTLVVDGTTIFEAGKVMV